MTIWDVTIQTKLFEHSLRFFFFLFIWVHILSVDVINRKRPTYWKNGTDFVDKYFTVTPQIEHRLIVSIILYCAVNCIAIAPTSVLNTNDTYQTMECIDRRYSTEETSWWFIFSKHFLLFEFQNNMAVYYAGMVWPLPPRQVNNNSEADYFVFKQWNIQIYTNQNYSNNLDKNDKSEKR